MNLAPGAVFGHVEKLGQAFLQPLATLRCLWSWRVWALPSFGPCRLLPHWPIGVISQEHYHPTSGWTAQQTAPWFHMVPVVLSPMSPTMASPAGQRLLRFGGVAQSQIRAESNCAWSWRPREIWPHHPWEWEQILGENGRFIGDLPSKNVEVKMLMVHSYVGDGKREDWDWNVPDISEIHVACRRLFLQPLTIHWG